MEKQTKNVVPQEGIVQARKSLPAAPAGTAGSPKDSEGGRFADDQVSEEERRLLEGAAFMKGGAVRRSPPRGSPQLLRSKAAAAMSTGGSLPDLSSVSEEYKRKREAEEEGDAHQTGERQLLSSVIRAMLKSIADLNRSIAAATTTRRDVVAEATKLDILARKFANGKLETLLDALVEISKMVKHPRLEKPKTVEIGVQTDPEPEKIWATKRVYKRTSIKEGSPLSAGPEWDLAVMRKKEDKGMEQGIKRMFRDRFGAMAQSDKELVHLKTTTCVMGLEEEETPITRHVSRIDMDETRKLKDRIETVLGKLAKDRRNRLAIV